MSTGRFPKREHQGPTWAEAVAAARRDAEQQRWRLAGIHRLDGWESFVVSWRSCAGFLANASDARVPRGVVGFNDTLAWAWDEVDHLVRPALRMIDSGSALPSAVVEFIFPPLQSAGVIFPDGGVLQAAVDRIERRQSIADIVGTVEYNELLVRGAEAAAKSKRLANPLPDAVHPKGPSR